MEANVKIIPERVTVIPDAQRNELTVIMEGFRLNLSGEEARALSYALAQGVKQLSPAEPTARAFPSSTSPAFAQKPATQPASPDAATKSGSTPADVIRSISA
ncbi:MAG TPA: hypothetical protein VMA53_29100 [Stellaceae bacterium]|nr:hypothetical protein [Stellaceae bacterium]